MPDHNPVQVPVTYLFGSSKLAFPTTTTSVFHSSRMADPDVEDDVIHGKRFTDASGKPASIEDIMMQMGVIGSERK